MLTSVLVSLNCQDSSDGSCKCDDYQFQRLILQFPALGKKLSYFKHAHHNPSIKYAPRCWVKRKWLNGLLDKPFPEVQTNQVESIKTKRRKVPWPNNEIHSSCCRTNSILPVSLVAPHLQSIIWFSDVWRVFTWKYCQNQITASDVMKTGASMIQYHFISILGKAITSFLGWNNTSLTKRDFFKRVEQVLRLLTEDWMVETCSRRSLSFENLLGKAKSVR